MRLILSILFLFIFSSVKSQCYELLDNRLDNIGDIPYVMVEKFVFDLTPGKTKIVKIKNVAYKTKLGFIFRSYNVGDTMDVSLLTLNRKVLTRRKLTNTDYFLRYEPFRKSEYYFLVIETKPKLDSLNKPVTGCVGLAVVERVKKKTFKKLQKIEWVEK
jgi:hypothetical protein